MDRYQSLTSDNPVQQRNIAEMRDIVQRRLALLQQGIEIRKTGGSDATRLMLLTGTGKAEMDRLRNLADKMEGEEQRLLAIRTKDARTATLRARLRCL